MGQSDYIDGVREYKNGNYNKSKELLTKSIEKGEEVAKSYMFRGTVNGFLNQLYAAISDLDKSFALDSSNYEIYFYYGKVYGLHGFDRISLNYYDKGIKINPDVAKLYDDRAVIRSNLNALQGALRDANRAILLDSNEGWYYSNRGFIKYQLLLYDEAIKDYDKSIILDPFNNGLATKKQTKS